MSGVLGMIATDLARYTLFTNCLMQLRAPVNTEIQWAIGGDFAINRNRVVAAALDKGAEWVIFVDDDMAFPPDHLMKLLAHEQPVVASLYLNRTAPFYPMAFNGQTTAEDGEVVYTPVDLVGAPETGLVPILAAGTGGMLIRSEVFHALGEKDWFRPEQGSEDISFCRRASEAGFPLYLDLGCPMGHMGTHAIWPTFQDDAWATGITLSDRSSFYVGTPGQEMISGEDLR